MSTIVGFYPFYPHPSPTVAPAVQEARTNAKILGHRWCMGCASMHAAEAPGKCGKCGRETEWHAPLERTT